MLYFGPRYYAKYLGPKYSLRYNIFISSKVTPYIVCSTIKSNASTTIYNFTKQKNKFDHSKYKVAVFIYKVRTLICMSRGKVQELFNNYLGM